jgi:Ca2+-binding EF-hand superfamily protein
MEYCCLHKFLSLMQHAFFSGDRDRSGRLDANEIHVALGVGQMATPFPVVQVLFNKYNRDGHGCTFGDFLQVRKREHSVFLQV